MCPGCASPGKGAKPAGGGSTGSGSSAFSKYMPVSNGDSNSGYFQSGLRAFRATPYASDISMSPGVYKPASSMERYTPPKSASDSFLGMDALYRAAKGGPMPRPPSVETELEQRENRKKKFLQ